MQDFMDSVNWDDVKVQKGGMVRHGHRINIEEMSDLERNSLLDALTDCGISFSLRNATTDSEHVHAGDLTVRVTEPKSVEKLRYSFFRWARQGNGLDYPTEETISDYNARIQQEQDKRERDQRKKNYLGNNPSKWDDVRVLGADGFMYHGHRINIQNLSEEKRNIIRKELESLGIHFEKRQATKDTPLVKKGDLTFRVIEPESVKTLRQEYFDPSPRKDLPIKEAVPHALFQRS